MDSIWQLDPLDWVVEGEGIHFTHRSKKQTPCFLPLRHETFSSHVAYLNSLLTFLHKTYWIPPMTPCLASSLTRTTPWQATTTPVSLPVGLLHLLLLAFPTHSYISLLIEKELYAVCSCK